MSIRLSRPKAKCLLEATSKDNELDELVDYRLRLGHGYCPWFIQISTILGREERLSLMPRQNQGSAYYRDTSGKQYFQQYQDPLARGGSFLNVPLYQPFVRPSDV